MKDFSSFPKDVQIVIAGDGAHSVGRTNLNEVKSRLDVVTVSEANSHEHWRKRQKRAKYQRALAKNVLARAKPQAPCTVTMTRVSSRTLDSDNIHGALKHIRDGIADAIGIDDRDPRVSWVCEQRKGDRGERAVEIVIAEVVS